MITYTHPVAGNLPVKIWASNDATINLTQSRVFDGAKLEPENFFP